MFFNCNIKKGQIFSLLILSIVGGNQSYAEESLAKKSQNPLGTMISLNLEYNYLENVGPDEDSTDHVVNLKPVYPIAGDGYNWILRAVVPVIYQDERYSGQGSESGLGDINLQAYWVPDPTGPITWGIGPSLVIPTATDDRLGSDKWSLGPALAIIAKPGKWLVGALTQNVWDIAGDSDEPDVNQFLFQYFINYNFDNGWYFTSTPTMTANWEADSSSDRWTIPVGGGVGKVVRLGNQPIDFKLQAYKNVERPHGAAEWSMQFNMKLLFPK
ncbi:MAG: transporter [Gammaproteobacteria bacterium]|nr:transporter [Gammaproteobacteria bacterium]